MYVQQDNSQISLTGFNASLGVKLNEKNEWVRAAGKIPWKALELEYAKKFESNEGNVAIPFRHLFGASIIKARLKLSDRKTVEAISENPYLQYFIGLSSYVTKSPFKYASLCNFRKRLNVSFLMQVNEGIIDQLGKAKSKAEANSTRKINPENLVKTVILDATCSPSDIRYPQDVSLLNEGREKLEDLIDHLCETLGLKRKPRTYRKIARKDYLSHAKKRKHTAKETRFAVKKQLGYVRRDIQHVEELVAKGGELTDKEKARFDTIVRLYEQQKFMYENKTHTVKDRIVSLSQPYLRPIVRGKAKSPVEFGAKYDVSVDERGFGRLERIQFTPYNESTAFIDAVERYKSRTGSYPERALVDQIYRTTDNIKYCKERNIRLSGPKLGRPKKEKKVESRKVAYKDNVDRIEVERFFSAGKRCEGMGLIRARFEESTFTSICIGVLAVNLFTVGRPWPFFCIYFIPAEYGVESSVSFAIFE